jgi:hypothetical protein
MITKRSMKLIVAIIPLSLIILSFLVMKSITVMLNGQVCNHGSNPIWLTVTESGRKKAYSLSPEQCTDVFTQDAEAVWGKDCSTEPCKVQAWKVAAGHFDIEDHGASHSDPVLQIKGWGVGSRWHISSNWPEPDLSTIHYRLVR